MQFIQQLFLSFIMSPDYSICDINIVYDRDIIQSVTLICVQVCSGTYIARSIIHVTILTITNNLCYVDVVCCWQHGIIS